MGGGGRPTSAVRHFFRLPASCRPSAEMDAAPADLASLSSSAESAGSAGACDAASLLGTLCGCARARTRLAVGESCYKQFSPCEVEKYWEQWRALHKLDQDRFMFDCIRGLAMQQGILPLDGDRPDRPQHLSFSFLGRRVCLPAFLRLSGIGASRFRRIKKAVVTGQQSAPADLRYLKGHRAGIISTVRTRVYTFLQWLYDTQAEVLPEDAEEIKAVPSIVNTAGDPWDSLIWAEVESDVSAHAPAAASSPAVQTVRYLPPGTISDLWKEFLHTEGVACSWRTFYEVWKQDFQHTKLKFRQKTQHKLCTVCIKYKLAIRALGHDLYQREKQTALFFQHVKNQNLDRKVLATIRARSREKMLHVASDADDLCIHIEVDAVDQAKFAWPRSRAFSAGQFSSTPRPRLHVTGMLVHGYMKFLFVSEADRKKDSNYTMNLLSYALTQLRDMGVPLHRAVVHVGMDNTGRENKNSLNARFYMFLVATGRVRAIRNVYLRTGHTHELIDQFLGELCKHILHKGELHTPADFVAECSAFLSKMHSKPGHELFGHAVKVDHVYDFDGWLRHMGVKLEGLGGPAAPHDYHYLHTDRALAS